MSKLFMYGTSLEGIEQLMMLVPNFSPRRSGIIINNYFNCKGDGKNCNFNMISIINRCNYCGHIHSNNLSSVDRLGYKDLVKECFGKIKSYSLKERLKFLTNNFKGEMFLSLGHKEKFYSALHNQDLDIYDISPRYTAILFLVTADEILWKVAKEILRPNEFDFNKVNLREINTGGYALYQTAKTIWTGKECIRINELADEDLIDDMTFKAIINSALITRYGSDIFLITK